MLSCAPHPARAPTLQELHDSGSADSTEETLSKIRTCGAGRAMISGETFGLSVSVSISISDSAFSSRVTILLKKCAAWAPAITRRSKPSVSVNVGHATIASPRTTGRFLAIPNDTPSGCVHVPATTSTPYLAGELTRTAPPRYLVQILGIRQGKPLSRVESQDGSRPTRVVNSRHCLFVDGSQTASSWRA